MERTEFHENDRNFPRKSIIHSELIKHTVIYFTAIKISKLIVIFISILRDQLFQVEYTSKVKS